ncbi:MAG: peptide deformylase [Vampirovibrionales bacterium]|nr:peptide deformylase [Vampirovibrionales bacterium]
MSVLKVYEYGEAVLRTPAEPVHKVSAKIQKLVSDMFETMVAQDGVGLAAPQVGVSKQVLVLDCSPDNPKDGPMVMINPKIVQKSGAYLSREGCLSFPNVYIDVKRYETITVRFMDLKGRNQQLTISAERLLCRAIQHEIDHLNGILFIDHAMDRFGTDQLLAQAGLPAIEPGKLLSEPEIEALLKQASAALPENHPIPENVLT